MGIQIFNIPCRHNAYVEGYTTWWVLRIVYQVLEFLTLYQVYWWNHDDESNLLCHPNEYISFLQLMSYRKMSPLAVNFIFSQESNFRGSNGRAGQEFPDINSTAV